MSSTSYKLQLGGWLILLSFTDPLCHVLVFQDELMAWWGATTRAGGKIPSEEDLKVKLEERKKFGF